MNDPLRQIEAIIDRLDCNDAEFWTALDSRSSPLSNAERQQIRGFGQFGQFGQSTEEPSRSEATACASERPKVVLASAGLSRASNPLQKTVQTVQTVQKLQELVIPQADSVRQSGRPTVQNRPSTVQDMGEPSRRRANSPLAGPLVARLAAVGATVREWDGGGQSQIELPAGIPADLLHEVEARGWRIIPGGRANPDAVHDSWLAGVPIAELEP
jgi:hypothetical protein